MSQDIEQLKTAADRLRARAAIAKDKETVNMVMVNGVWINSSHYLTTTKREIEAQAEWLEYIYYLELDGESEGTSFGELNAAINMAKAVNGAKESDS